MKKNNSIKMAIFYNNAGDHNFSNDTIFFSGDVIIDKKRAGGFLLRFVPGSFTKKIDAVHVDLFIDKEYSNDYKVEALKMISEEIEDQGISKTLYSAYKNRDVSTPIRAGFGVCRKKGFGENSMLIFSHNGNKNVKLQPLQFCRVMYGQIYNKTIQVLPCNNKDSLLTDRTSD